MSLYRRKDSPYWWIKLPPIMGERKPLQKSTGTANKRKAQEFHDKCKAERWDLDKLGIKPRCTWHQAVAKYLEETSYKRTQEKDKAILRWLDPWMGGKYLDEINRDLIDQIKAARVRISAPSTTNRYLAVIRAVLKKACDEWEWIERVPKISMYHESGERIRSLTHDEFARLYRELPEHLADMTLFSVATGLRQRNVSQLKWKQVDMSLCHAWIEAAEHKNGKAHAVPLNQTAMGVLQKRRGIDSTYVFTYRGKPVANVSTKAWWAALERAGIEDFRWHDLRHTFATWHRQAGTPTHELQRLGGWKTLSMVERYAHIAPEGLQSAACRLDNVLRGYAVATPQKKRD